MAIDNIQAFKKLNPPLIHSGSNDLSFCGRELKMIDNIQGWVDSKGFTDIFKKYTEGPEFPLFYRNMKPYQIIDWNLVHEDEQEVAECGAYDVKTGQLCLGVRILQGSYEELKFGERVTTKESSIILMGEFKEGKLSGLGRVLS